MSACELSASIACASILRLSSWLLVQVVVGHFEMMATAYLPWILAFFWESIERQRLTLSCVAALFFAIAFGEGGIYVCARIALLIPLLAIYLSATEGDKWPLKAMAIFAIAGFGFAAIKLLPIRSSYGFIPVSFSNPKAILFRLC